MSAPSKTPAHLRIRNYLLDRIKDLPPNARLPTEVVLAEQFGVSRLTAHKAVMRLQQEGLVVRRGRGGTFVAREAHRVHRDGGRGRNGTLAIAYPNWFSYDFWRKVDAAERLALPHGIAPLPIKLNPDTPMSEVVSMMQGAEASALLLIPPGGSVREADVRTLEALDCPCVLLEPNEHVRKGHKVYAVAPDFRRIGVMEGQVLLRNGHRRIAYVREEPWSAASAELLQGLREAAEARGLPASAIILPGATTRPWDDTSAAGYERTSALMTGRRRPSALVFDAQAGAHAGLRALNELGLRVPEDVSVLVSAPEHPFARYDWPRIGTVAVSAGDLVQRAIQLLVRPSRDVVHRVAPSVSLRESVAPPPSSGSGGGVTPPGEPSGSAGSGVG